MSALSATFPPGPLTAKRRTVSWTLGLWALSAAMGAAHAQDDATLSSTTSLRLTSPAGGLWVRGKVFGPTTQAESANLGGGTVPAWRLLGSYDLPRAGGLRASGGMIGVSRRTALGASAMHEGQRWDSGLLDTGPRNSLSAAQSGSTVSVPYAGISYTNAASTANEGRLASSGWSFNVDLGVMVLAPRSLVRLGGASTQDRMDELMRDLRLSPLLQLGVSYSF